MTENAIRVVLSHIHYFDTNTFTVRYKELSVPLSWLFYTNFTKIRETISRRFFGLGVVSTSKTLQLCISWNVWDRVRQLSVLCVLQKCHGEKFWKWKCCNERSLQASYKESGVLMLVLARTDWKCVNMCGKQMNVSRVLNGSLLLVSEF